MTCQSHALPVGGLELLMSILGLDAVARSLGVDTAAIYNKLLPAQVT